MTQQNDSQVPGIFDEILQMLKSVEGNIKNQTCTATAQRPPCPPGYNQYLHHCFKLFETRITFMEAAAACARARVPGGGTLAMPQDRGTNGFLVSLINAKDRYSSGDYWFGLHDRNEEGKWEWMDGKALNSGISMWGMDQPNDIRGGEDCASYGWKNLWYDTGCSRKNRFICQVLSSGLLLPSPEGSVLS
ncbi:alpha-N-acetylgalactosamine-specific lectin-like [Branchiostoma floridae]|uniref:Alpha-N-acetylgalactosamine-specific lectin-like n=1 Tax=Branchiostoma floridae TaxID=7739 RepID=A0A9J7LT99_BRAFL|nr:alpha-N-acetylgalactosamine-specific lectin-like [Branchiostoma floridae]